MRSRVTLSWLTFLILFLASALTYLPFVPQIRFSNDDWYLMYGAHVRGPDYFAPAYERDRPMRALVLAPEYSLFGDNALPYHLTSYAFRLLGAVTLFWLLNQLWPKTNPSLRGSDSDRSNLQQSGGLLRREDRPPRNDGLSDGANYQLPITNLLITLLFLLYPGFLSQPNPVDYQSQIIALWTVIASLALTVAALRAEKMFAKVAYILLSTVLAWIYLGLIEYYIGLEVLRLIIVYLLVKRNTQHAPITNSQFLISTLRAWLPFLLGPLTFLTWRLFFFTSERHATDVGLQLGALFTSPTTGLWWLARFVQDTLNVIFLAWGVPLYNLAFNLRLSQTWTGIALSVAVASGVVFILRRETRFLGENGFLEPDWKGEMLWVGIVTAMAGLVPVIIVNRHVEFFSLSRYTLASSVGAAMAVVAMLAYLSAPRLRWTLAGLLIAMSVMTHFANSARYANEAEAVRNFWWQVSWRAPQMRDGTTLAAYFPAPIQEDYFLWGAANLIYNPEPQISDPAEAPLAAALLTPENVTRILTGKDADEPDRRNAHLVIDYGNMLILAQAGPGSCVRVLDGSQPELSANDDPRIMVVAASSRIGNVITDSGHAAPPASIFGSEPAHEWCWYYEQASLARQRGDWDEAAALGDEALERGFYPSDSVEWFPFLQAYAALGREKDLKKLSSILGADPFLENQACAILSKMGAAGTLKPEIESSAMEWYCGK
jgi:hypothetical protein